MSVLLSINIRRSMYKEVTENDVCLVRPPHWLYQPFSHLKKYISLTLVENVHQYFIKIIFLNGNCFLPFFLIQKVVPRNLLTFNSLLSQTEVMWFWMFLIHHASQKVCRFLLFSLLSNNIIFAIILHTI